MLAFFSATTALTTGFVASWTTGGLAIAIGVAPTGAAVIGALELTGTESLLPEANC